MAQEVRIDPPIGYRDPAARPVRRETFFFGSGVLLLILLAGFFRTLYARAFFDVPPIPSYLYAHGALVTCWFVWLFCQTTLVAIHRTDIHRRLGLVGGLLGVAVVGAGLMATFGLVPRLPDIGVDLSSGSGGIWGPQPAIYFVSWVVALNFSMISGFVLFLSTALLLRHRPDAHKRLMLLASMSLMSPPLARISFWRIFGWIDEISFVTIATLLLLIPLGLHDLLVNRRLQPVTLAGGLCFVLVVLAPVGLAETESVQTFVHGLD